MTRKLNTDVCMLLHFCIFTSTIVLIQFILLIYLNVEALSYLCQLEPSTTVFPNFEVYILFAIVKRIHNLLNTTYMEEKKVFP